MSGTAFIDYFYLLDEPSGDREGDNGFTFRRLYLTTDFDISEAFSARARLEAGDSVVDKGATPFVKDLYLRWQVGGGHRLTFGLTSVPNFNLSEDVWGYRSLEQTLLDLAGIVSSRDVGVRADGPLLGDGTVRYAVMVGNGQGTVPDRADAVDTREKRVYGQLRFLPTEALVFTAGVDYAAQFDDGDDQLGFNGFAGYRGASVNAGVEAFWNRIRLDAGDPVATGVSIFGHVRVRPSWYAVARYDHVFDDELVQETFFDDFALFGVAYQPVPEVRFIPNVVAMWDGEQDAPTVTGRVTLELDI